MTEVPKAMGGRDCDPCDGLEVSSLELLHNQKAVLMLRLQTLLDHVETVQTMSRVKYDATAFTLCQRMDAQLDLLQFWSRLSCAVSLSRRDDTDELQLYISRSGTWCCVE